MSAGPCADCSGTSEYDYDIRDRLTSYTPRQPTGHSAVTYAYNNLNQKTSISATGLSVTYDYYANGWLKQVRSLPRMNEQGRQANPTRSKPKKRKPPRPAPESVCSLQ